MMKLIIDRFEGDYAVCEKEDRSIVNVPKDKLPLDCAEGDCLILMEDGSYRKDKDTTEARKKKLRDKMNRLFG